MHKPLELTVDHHRLRGVFVGHDDDYQTEKAERDYMPVELGSCRVEARGAADPDELVSVLLSLHRSEWLRLQQRLVKSRTLQLTITGLGRKRP